MKNNKRQIVKIIVFIASILIIFMSVSFAFINLTLQGTKRQVVTAGILDLVLEEDENNLTIENAYPMYDEVGMIQDAFTFRLINNGTKTVKYQLKLVDITPKTMETDQKCSELGEITIDSSESCRKLNYPDELRQASLAICQRWWGESITEEECLEYEEDDGYTYNGFEGFIDSLINWGYDIEDTRTIEEVYPDNYVVVDFPALSKYDVKYGLTKDGKTTISYVYNRIMDSGYIEADTTYNYELRLWIEDSVTDNTAVAGKSLSYRVDVKIEQVEETVYIGMLQAAKSQEVFWKYRTNITSIVFEDAISIPSENVIESWDVSINKDRSVMAYIEDDGLKTGTYKLHIQGDGVVYANVNSTDLFYNFTKLTSIEGLEYFDTSYVTNMSYMFQNCKELTTLDLSGLDTSNVVNMNSMFYNCSKLTSLDLSNLTNEKVTTMSYMLYNCSALTTLNLSGFGTSSVTDMSRMFSGCNSLAELNVSGFNTSKVTNMSGMFANCKALTTLNISGFNTSNVTDMSSMFGNCTKLTTLDISGFNTSSVTNMGAMFQGCSNLTTLNLSGLTNENVTNMGSMFQDCSSLTTLNLSNFGTSSVISMGAMFRGCKALETIDLSSFDTSNVAWMNQMFWGCSSITSIDASNFITSNVKSMGLMFADCGKLASVIVSSFDTKNVTDMSWMFRGSSLTTIDLSSFDTSNVTSMQEMFNGCSKLTSLDLSSFNTEKVTNMQYMFIGCSGLTYLDVSSFDTKNVTNMYGMFKGCSGLKTLDLSGFDTTNAARMGEMFATCRQLTTTFKIVGTKCTDYWHIFDGTSTVDGASFVVYGDGTNEELLQKMVATGGTNVIYGGVKEETNEGN